MGTINYGSSYHFYDAKGNRIQDNDITIGLIPCSHYSDEESGYKEFIDENGYSEDEIDRCQYDIEQDDVSYDDMKALLEDADLPHYFKVGMESGYYEGFYLVIKENIPWLFDDSKEKAEVQKDITLLRKVLMDSLNNGLCVVHPGWCNDYANHADSRKEVNEFIRALRQVIRDMDTVYTYERKKGGVMA